MRLDMFRKLDALAPAYLTRRRTGDLVGVATHDIELIEYFFAHTDHAGLRGRPRPRRRCSPRSGSFGWPLAAGAPAVPRSMPRSRPSSARARIDRLGSRAREMSGDLNAHAVDSVQGLGEIVAFQRVRARGRGVRREGEGLPARSRVPFLHDLTLQSARQEVATGLGGLAVVLAGAWLAASGRLDGGMLPLLTLLAMSAFVPVWEIAQVGRQLADTLGAARRVYAVHAEPVPVTDGPGVRRDDAASADIAPRDDARDASPIPGRRRPRADRRDASACPRAAPSRSSVRRARARPPSPTSCCASGIRTRARCASAATTCASTRSTTCGGASRWSPRTPISSTTRCAATSCSPGPGPSAEELAAAVDKAALDDFVAVAARRPRHRGGRARRPALGRTAPARGDRARVPEGRADPDPRRGDVAPRRGERAGGARRARRARRATARRWSSRTACRRCATPTRSSCSTTGASRRSAPTRACSPAAASTRTSSPASSPPRSARSDGCLGADRRSRWPAGPA